MRGRDEVARLPSDCNAVAADLERYTGELQAGATRYARSRPSA